jgi:hypothetical protein
MRRVRRIVRRHGSAVTSSFCSSGSTVPDDELEAGVQQSAGDARSHRTHPEPRRRFRRPTDGRNPLPRQAR